MVAETISRTDLARKTREVIDAARRRGPVMVESYGEEQVAVLDAIDFRLLQAAATYGSATGGQPPSLGDVPRGLTTAEVEEQVRSAGGDVQAAWNLVLCAYHDEAISLARTAELLHMSRWELQDRLSRLGIAIRDAHENMAAAVAEAAALRR